MKLKTRKKSGFPSLYSDFFNPASSISQDLFNLDYSSPARIGVNIPSANILETPKEFKVELAAPGLERKDFNVEIENKTLTVSAEKAEEKKESEGQYSRREYSFNAFRRTFALPDNVKDGNIDAKYENGILKIVIPKMKETPVKAAHKIKVS